MIPNALFVSSDEGQTGGYVAGGKTVYDVRTVYKGAMKYEYKVLLWLCCPETVSRVW